MVTWLMVLVVVAVGLGACWADWAAKPSYEWCL
jgi:hypothetical protein